MIFRSITILQRFIAALMLLIAFSLCVFVPFEAELNGTKSPIGYALIWAPPSRIKACESAFMPRNPFENEKALDSGAYAWQLVLQSRCNVQPSFSQISLTIAGAAILSALLLLLSGLQAVRSKSVEDERVGGVAKALQDKNKKTFKDEDLVSSAAACGIDESEKETNSSHWFVVSEFGESKVYIDRSSVNLKNSFGHVNVRYDLTPSGTDKRNNKPVKQMFMQEEYDLINGKFRVHRIEFVYEDGACSDPLITAPEWKDASEGNAKTLAALKVIATG